MDGGARIVVDANSRVLAASDEALALLEMSFEQLAALPPGALSSEADLEAVEGLEEEWRRAGAGAMFGAGNVHLLDGRVVRMRYLILPHEDGTFEITLERIEESTSKPPTAYTVGNALSAWRAADRRLQRLEPGDPEWADVTAEVERFRIEYHRLVASERSLRPG